jgi:phospholipid transport system substrate-binding protein
MGRPPDSSDRGRAAVSRRRLVIAGLALAALLLPNVGYAETIPGPADTLRAFHGVLLNVMQNAAKLGAKGRYQKLEPVVLRSFDVPFMTRLSVGTLWSKLPAEQRQRAWKAFGRYIAATYASRFDGYAGEQFRLLGEQPIKHGTLVRTQLVKADGETIAINYVLHDNETAWQIRDVYLSGTISELATRRSEFSAILRNQGVEGLITMLNRKADELAD